MGPHESSRDGAPRGATDRTTQFPRRACAARACAGGPFATFDISSLLSQMKREDTWRAARRNAVTLVKGRGPRVVLVAMHLGSTIAFNGTEGPVVLQVIEGRV